MNFFFTFFIGILGAICIVMVPFLLGIPTAKIANKIWDTDDHTVFDTWMAGLLAVLLLAAIYSIGFIIRTW